MDKPWNEHSPNFSEEKLKRINELKYPMSNWIKDGTMFVPAMPQVIARAMKIAGKPDTTVNQLEELIRQDQSVAARLMQIANSVFFSRTTQAKSIKDAIVRIGQVELKNTLYGLFVQTRLFTSEMYSELIRSLWLHSLGVSEIARRLALPLNVDYDVAFLAGLLHDVGKAALLGTMKDEIEDKSHYTADVVEEAMEPIHELAGGILLKSWKLPEDIVMSVISHHNLERAGEHKKLAMLIHMADILAFRIGIGVDTENKTKDSEGEAGISPLFTRHLLASAINLENYGIRKELELSMEVIKEIEDDAEELRNDIFSLVLGGKKSAEADQGKSISAAIRPDAQIISNSSSSKTIILVSAFLLAGLAGLLIYFFTK